MQNKFRRGDAARIISDNYGPVSGLTGTVTEDFSSDFRLSLGGFEVQIKNPETDLAPVPVEVEGIAAHLNLVKSLLPKGASFEIKPGGTAVVRMDEGPFRHSFSEFDYDLHRYNDTILSVYLRAEIDGIEFRATASATPECVAEAEAWIAAHPDPEDAAS